MTDTPISKSYVKISPKAIYEEISKTVIGQEQAKRMVSNVVFLHFVRYIQSVKEGKLLKKTNSLLMGPTGCGKTFIVREASKAIRKLTGYPICPVLEVDCTELTARGWEGDSLTDHIKDHYEEFGENEATFNSTIVFLDEFDKLCKPAVSSSGNDHNRLTQYNLLKTIEGAEIKIKSSYGIPRKISTHKMMFIMAGNFSEVRALREQRKNVMGFRQATEEEKFVDFHTELENVGMVTQLVGRTPHVAELYDLEPPDLKIILNEHLLPEIKDTWRYLNRDLNISEKDIEKIVQNCYTRKTGARGLQTDLAKHIEDDLFDAEFII